MNGTQELSATKLPQRLKKNSGEVKKFKFSFQNFPDAGMRKFWIVNFLLFNDLKKMLSQKAKRELVKRLLPDLFDSENYRKKCDQVADILCTDLYTEEAEFFDEQAEIKSIEVVQP